MYILLWSRRVKLSTSVLTSQKFHVFFQNAQNIVFNFKVIVVFVSFTENPRKIGKTQKILIVCITALWVLTLCLVES